MDYTNMTGLNGADNQGGLTQEILFAPLGYFNVIQDFDTTLPNGVPPGTLQISAAHTFKTGKGWHSLYATMDSSKLTGEPTGERDGRGYNFKVEFFHPGGKEAAAAFARQCKNDQFIVLIKTPNGETYQIGTRELYAEISAKYDTGTLSGGRNGFTFEITSFANGLIFYKGAITRFPEPVTP